MQLKADAFREYNEAAILDKLLSGFPEVVRAFAEPLSKVDRITVVSTGGGADGGGTGVSRVTADIAQMVAQVPALLEALTGKKMSELLERVRPLGPGGAGSEQSGAKPPATTEPKGKR